MLLYDHEHLYCNDAYDFLAIWHPIASVEHGVEVRLQMGGVVRLGRANIKSFSPINFSEFA